MILGLWGVLCCINMKMMLIHGGMWIHFGENQWNVKLPVYELGES